MRVIGKTEKEQDRWRKKKDKFTKATNGSALILKNMLALHFSLFKVWLINFSFGNPFIWLVIQKDVDDNALLVPYFHFLFLEVVMIVSYVHFQR